MRLLLWIVGTYVLLVAQTTLCPTIAVGPFAPSLLIALCVPCCCRRRSQWAICGAALWGLAVDALGSGPAGVNLISFTLVAAVLQRTDLISPTRTLLASALTIFLLTGVEIAANWPWGQLREQANDLAVLWAGNTLYGMVIAGVWIFAFDVLHRTIRHLSGQAAHERQWSRTAIPWL